MFGALEPKQMRNKATLFAIVMTMGVPAIAQTPSPAAQPAPVVYRIEPAVPQAGANITVVGRGFASSNTVVFGKTSIRDVPVAWAAGITCVQGDSACHPGINQGLVFTVPPDATAGRYDISVENGNGVSNAITVAVSAPRARAP
jgi:hypothetical protein